MKLGRKHNAIAGHQSTGIGAVRKIAEAAGTNVGIKRIRILVAIPANSQRLESGLNVKAESRTERADRT